MSQYGGAIERPRERARNRCPSALASDRRHCLPTLPVVILSRSAASRQGVARALDRLRRPRRVRCASATASAVADALGVPLVLIHVPASVSGIARGTVAAAPLQPLLTEDPAWSTAMFDRLTGARPALDGSDAAQTSAQRGPLGPALVGDGRAKDAALIVCASDRTWLHRDQPVGHGTHRPPQRPPSRTFRGAREPLAIGPCDVRLAGCVLSRNASATSGTPAACQARSCARCNGRW
jgi:hypothetical protein